MPGQATPISRFERLTFLRPPALPGDCYSVVCVTSHEGKVVKYPRRRQTLTATPANSGELLKLFSTPFHAERMKPCSRHRRAGSRRHTGEVRERLRTRLPSRSHGGGSWSRPETRLNDLVRQTRSTTVRKLRDRSAHSAFSRLMAALGTTPRVTRSPIWMPDPYSMP
jgi:hypothetical protein